MFPEMLVLFLSLATLAYGSSAEPDGSAQPLVQTSRGAMRGTTMTSRSGKTIYAFRGVRYARPPTGELRFKAPVAVTEEWTGVFNATEDGASCPQASNFIDGPISEDCLFLNIFTTKVSTEEINPLHPVIVWFHPGGWFVGSGQSNFAGPQYLLDDDIVFVSINSRLGAFGYLSTGDDESPGNYGLKDQVAALQWIRDNVQYFGGDPHSVTLFGGTSGGANAQYHMLSPQSAGLFHRVISSSGSCLCSWALNRDPLALAKRQAALLNCPHDESATSKEIVDCLRTKDANEISKSFSSLREWHKEPFVIFAPVVEQEDSSNHPFLTDEPAKLLNNGNFTQVPVLTGIVKDEMIERANAILTNETLLDDLNNKFDHILPYAFYYEKGTPKSRELSQKIKEFYFKDSVITKDALQPATEMFSDSFFLYGVDQAVKMISKISKEPVYYYYMTYTASNRTASAMLGEEESSEPTSTDDLSYLIYASKLYPFFGKNHPEEPFSKLLVKIWTNFAKTGNPTPQENDSLLNVTWKPHTSNDLFCMEIGPKLQMTSSVLQERAAFWESIYRSSSPN